MCIQAEPTSSDLEIANEQIWCGTYRIMTKSIYVYMCVYLEDVYIYIYIYTNLTVNGLI
jgi:hypothetical protein